MSRRLYWPNKPDVNYEIHKIYTAVVVGLTKKCFDLAEMPLSRIDTAACREGGMFVRFARMVKEIVVVIIGENLHEQRTDV